MICMKIMGGQGNQMFQYALGRYLSMKNKCTLEYEMSYFEGKDSRVYTLDKFFTVGKPTRKWSIKLYHWLPRGKRLLDVFLHRIKEHGSWYHEDVKNIRNKNAWLEGYWASPKYFEEIRDILIHDFRCKVELSEHTKRWKKEIISDKNPTVSLHIRRGDYVNIAVNMQIYKMLPATYYKYCLKDLENKFGHLSIYVFSNDMDWVKENMDFGDNYVKYVVGNDEEHGFEDMILMWECEHHIIANSTFSWWGAYLSTRDGETYVPSEWYIRKGDLYDIRDLYPKEWIKVKVDS